MKQRLFFIILFILILAGGAYLRLEHLGRQSYWMDEGYTINAVISGMQNGTKQFASILDSGERYFCPMYCLPTMAITDYGLRITNSDSIQSAIRNPQFAIYFRIISSIFGILFILLSYVVSKTFFKDKWVALLTMFLTSFSYYQIAWSRQARWYTELEVFFWLALLSFYLFLRHDPWNPPPTPPLSGRGALLNRLISTPFSKSPLPDKGGVGGGFQTAFYFLLFILFSFAAILTHPTAYALPVIALLWFLIDRRTTIKQIGIAALFVLGFVALIDYGFGLHILITNLQSHFSLHQNALYYVSFYWRNYWLFMILSIFGFVLANKEQKKSITLFSIPFFLYLIGLSFFTEAIEYRYAFSVTVIWYALGAFGMMQLLRKIKSTRSLGYQFGSQLLVGIPFVVFIILCLSHLVFIPQSFYWLEADDPAEIHHRDYYAYTPQPDFNAAYENIKREMKPEDVIISSHPHFNKIFLDQSGYWLGYDYLGRGIPIPKEQTTEFYVGASVIHDLGELQEIMKTKHGFIVFDMQTKSRRISQDMILFIEKNAAHFFEKETNNYSKIWVYRF